MGQKIINLNELDKPFITKDLLLKEVSDENIFRYYIKNLEVGKITNSPLRRDKVPSFGVYYARKYNQLFFKDFKLGAGDCIKFVSWLYKIPYNLALSQIAVDFDLDKKYKVDSSIKKSDIIGIFNNSTTHTYSKKTKIIAIEERSWEYHDLIFWERFGITLDILQRYNVYPVKFLFINENVFPVDKYCYAFEENKDDKITYKIYQPFSEKYKWISNHNRTIHQGYTQLPEKGDLLIITKSLKDVMSLCKVVNIPAIAIQSESLLIKDSVIVEYKGRFYTVLVLFDNDPAGITLSFRYKTKFNLPFIIIPYQYDCKDFSDLVKKYGVEESKKIFNKLI